MPRSRRLRRLVPDEALFDRRVAGESLRTLARDYGVVHTTLARYFRHPEALVELGEARQRLRVKRKALAAEAARERRWQQDVRRRAQDDATRDRELEAWRPTQRRSAYEAWLDGHDAPQGFTSRELYSTHDRLAEKVVAEGGGIEEVIEATGLRSREDVYRLDAQVMERGLKNDALRRSHALPDIKGLRRLAPDSTLISRRAAGEPLRSLATEYDVSHTTLIRYFQRPEVAKQLHTQQPRRRNRRARVVIHTPQRPRRSTPAEIVAQLRTEIRRIRCPVHGTKLTLRAEAGPEGSVRLLVSLCCPKAKRKLERTVSSLAERTGAPLDPG